MDNDGQHAPAKKAGTVTLEAGLQPVTILYFAVQRANEQSLSLDIKYPDGRWHRVTGDMFFRDR